ncbi:MAG: lamin tail domain-containing protein, partial [Nitrososphaerales archaeon]
EWLELFNRTDLPFDLAGWQLDDIADGGSKPFTLPAGTLLAPHGFLVVFHAQSGISMNNDGDTIRLVAPGGNEADAFRYASSRPDRSFSRTADDPGAWTADYLPSPGAANLAPTPTPSPTATATATPVPDGVFLNEVLPDPEAVDWDTDGEASWRDEWLELYNMREQAAALGGWQVLHATGAYTIPAGTTIWPHSYLLLFRRQTGLALSDWRDSVTLLRPDGRAADQFTYNAGPGADRSYCRVPDGDGGWTGGCESTPGQPNKLLPAPPPAAPAPAASPQAILRTPQTVAGARTAKEDTRVIVTGIVTFPPGLIPKTIYLQDKTGGIRVYLRQGQYGPIKLWDRVRVSGWTRNFYGETEISVPDPAYITVLGPGKAVSPKPITSAGLIEANEGQLVQVIGAIERYETRALVLKDREGLVRIYFPETLPWRRPYVQIGQMWAVQGVLSQHVTQKTVDEGYEIIPRFRTDVAPGPAYLPTTGDRLMP